MLANNVTGYRCVSECRSRGRKFDPGLVPSFTFVEIDSEIISTIILLPSAELFMKEGLLSVKHVLVNRLFKLG